MKALNLTGATFGRLLVVERSKSRRGRARWKCLCDCGTTVTVDASNLTSKNTTSCGCVRREACRARERKKGHPTHGRVLSYYKKNAKARSLVWELTTEQFSALINSSCHYCGADPSVHLLAGCERVFNGIDRPDNDKGYTSDNVVPCCTRCNLAKHDMTTTQFKEWISKVYQHLIQKGGA